MNKYILEIIFHPFRLGFASKCASYKLMKKNVPFWSIRFWNCGWGIGKRCCCKSRFVIPGREEPVCLLSPYEREEKLSCSSAGIIVAVWERHVDLAFVQLSIPRSLILWLPSPFQIHPMLHSFCPASWSHLPQRFTPVPLILLPPTQPPVAALSTLCLV